MAKSMHSTDAIALDFAPAILRAQHENAAPLPRMVLYIALTLFEIGRASCRERVYSSV